MSTAAIAAAAGLGSPQARAADASADAGSQLSEVVVTATRRTENLQKVPIAVTAITADQITKSNVSTLSDLQYSIPNFVFGGESTARRPDIALRGIDSATRVPGFEGSIGFFVDGVYEPFPDQWNNPVIDVDRLEVLYGPQDSLFGKDTIAGAVSITTKKPADNLDGTITAEYGNYNYYQVKGALDVPIIKDVLDARVSGFVARRDGYVTNIYNGGKLDDLNQEGGRIQLRYTPTAKFELNFAVDTFDDHSGEIQAQTIGGLYSTGDPRTVDLNTTPKTTRSIWNANLTQQYTFDNGAKLTSISGFGQTRAHYHTDEDGNPANEWVTDIYDRTQNFSQEFRFTSPVGEKFDYLAGVYYLNTYWAQPGSLQTLPGDPNNDPGGLGVLNANGSVNYSDTYAKRVNGDTFAAYAYGNYHFTDKLSLSAGARASDDEKYLAYPGQVNFGAGFLNLCKLGRSFGAGCLIPGGNYATLPAYQDSLNEGAVTGSGSLNYQATDNILIYAKIANGFKGGGWNTDLQKTSPPAKFKPENVVYYEIGAKTEFFDKHLRFDIDGFYEDYKNKQETVFVNITQGFTISNAASATIDGFEASVTGVLGDFSASAGLGYLDPTYNNFQCTATVNCRGQQLVFATKTTGNLSLDYGHQLGDIGKLSVHFQATYRDKMYFTVPNDNADSVEAYTLLNARIGLTVAKGSTEVYVFGKNLANTTYRISNFPGDPAYPGFGATSDVLYGQPRFVGMGVTYHY